MIETDQFILPASACVLSIVIRLNNITISNIVSLLSLNIDVLTVSRVKRSFNFPSTYLPSKIR